MSNTQNTGSDFQGYDMKWDSAFALFTVNFLLVHLDNM